MAKDAFDDLMDVGDMLHAAIEAGRALLARETGLLALRAQLIGEADRPAAILKTTAVRCGDGASVPLDPTAPLVMEFEQAIAASLDGAENDPLAAPGSVLSILDNVAAFGVGRDVFPIWGQPGPERASFLAEFRDDLARLGNTLEDGETKLIAAGGPSGIEAEQRAALAAIRAAVSGKTQMRLAQDARTFGSCQLMRLGDAVCYQVPRGNGYAREDLTMVPFTG